MKMRFLPLLSQVPPRLRRDEVRARRPACRGRHKSQTDGHHSAGVECDRLCSRYDSVYAATVSTTILIIILIHAAFFGHLSG